MSSKRAKADEEDDFSDDDSHQEYVPLKMRRLEQVKNRRPSGKHRRQ